ncbi:putative HTH-type transcriptional regulator YmfC [Rubrobacter xylanophilus]|uniref:Putative HTH-type transcriptional regulator YmfC n=1 Tax=Rubrobacter xylanophilus TaxID=49319 RepID=A0A510HKK0_9ACTN|nr:putative HTH-type transcriptional regulator YmfC [Rubrobacter xylanophilus]
MAAGRRGLAPLSKNLLYVEVERRIEDLLVRKRYRVGDRIPPEAELVESLGVSRATVRAGLSRLVERGLLERRQGSGTFLARPPEGVRLRNGLERLESYTVHAERLGLELGSRGLKIERVAASAEEASALEVPEGTPLARVERVLLVDGELAAWMVDVVPEEIMAAGEALEGFDPNAMLLDLLVSRGVPITHSKLLIDAELISPDDPVGRALELGSVSAALSLIETMYLENGRPAQWSRNIFLPGHLDLHVVRELYEVRRIS